MSIVPAKKKLLTLCILREGDAVLLGLKKRGFGAGLWNGFGGKVEAGETIEEAARREYKEEANIDVHGLSERGVLTFVYEDGAPTLEVHVFAAASFTGTPEETEEMRPQWFKVAALPYDHMWADDPHWLPLFFAGKHFHGEFLFRGENTLLSHTLIELRAA